MMPRIVAPLAVAVMTFGAFVCSASPTRAGPVVPNHAVAANPAVTLVDGWWERDHEEQRARQNYWNLPPWQVQRYNRLQYEINQLQQQRREIDERIARAVQQQRRLLGFQGQ